ncbi:FtsW/RodA/SpoVE family cell cycle protein [Rhabdochlamydiaceae symbiont of Dictyostelium giganteum]|uniref:FtsW/RodA/SpoVE family cell cycle protein n=1 Tax=Rhabdochlamydiaceae symbiont of Dictyostelium giganteum TaxID=3342349 RepID=UPI00384CC4B7
MKWFNISLFTSVMIVIILGLSMIFNTTSAEAMTKSIGGDFLYQAVLKQVIYLLLGVLSGVGIGYLGYQEILKHSGSLLIFFTILLLLVFIPPIGMQVNGAYRWLNILGISFQPSEFVKYLIPLYFLTRISHHPGDIGFYFFIKILLILAIPIGLILIEPDNGTVAIILMGLMGLFVLTGIRWRYWMLPLCLLMGVGGGIASQMPHVHDRIRIYMNPELDLQGKGHQPHQAKIAAGSGGLWGKGLGESMQKLDYLPEARSDYIAAIFGEEFGFMGMMLLVILYMLIGYFGFSIAASAKELTAFYTAAILTFLVCFQAFLNLGVVSGLLPSKGTNLPFFSQGGSSLLANLMVIWMILSTTYEQRHVQKS